MNIQHTKVLSRIAVAIAAILFAACSDTPEPQVSDISWATIDSIYSMESKATELQKDEKWKQYKGQKVRWTGTVTEIGTTFGSVTLQVKMKSSTLTSDLIITLKDSQKAAATRLSQGNRVTFTGILDSWGTILPIALEKGEIAN